MTTQINCKHCKAKLKGKKTHAKHQLTFHKSKLSFSDEIKYTKILYGEEKKAPNPNKKKKNGPGVITGPPIYTPM